MKLYSEFCFLPIHVQLCKIECKDHLTEARTLEFKTYLAKLHWVIVSCTFN